MDILVFDEIIKKNYKDTITGFPEKITIVWKKNLS